MLDIPSRQDFASLTQAANAVLPVLVVGFARDTDDGRVSLMYSHPYGMSEYVVAASELPPALLPEPGSVLHVDRVAMQSRSGGAIEWPLLLAGVNHVVSRPVPDAIPRARLWLGLSQGASLESLNPDPLADLAAAGAGVLTRSARKTEDQQTLRRLDLAAALVPTLLHVLDVREVFDRLSSISQAALPHDMLTLGLYNEELTTLTMYAGTTQAETVGRTFPHPYPPAVTEAWGFDILDDRAAYPLERDRPPTVLGMRSSLRMRFRFGGQAIGGLGFHARPAAKYTTDDIAVARRLADFVASAVFHQRIAQRLVEEARHNEELRAANRNLELVDGLLAALIDTVDLRDVFGRISTVAGQVLPHDAASLVVCLPDGRHGRVYASSGFPVPPPEVQEIPQEVLDDPNWEHKILDDISESTDRRFVRFVEMGFHSVFRVPIRLDGRFAAALVFLSRGRAAFKPADVPIARRIADRMTVALARDRELAASRRADEATSRAAALEARVRALTDELDARTGYRRVVGESTQWRQVLTQAAQVAATDTTVLLLGESGTGKEVVARFLHRGSPRKGGPFVALNCAALPEQLLEAELFGYERGAYTGATQSKPGQLEQAAGGTLFLDEVAEMSPSAQAKFLRVLQEREFQRLGGTRVLRTGARVVAATNRDLPRAIANGHFREDLYYRLNVFAIRLPPLRDRPDDILPLSEAFLVEIGRGIGRPPAGISRDARQQLVEYHWPGNVRELRNILERAAILCDGGLITADHLALGPALPVPAPVRVPLPAPVVASAMPAVAAAVAGVGAPASAGDLEMLERTMIEQALLTARFNKSKAAKALGMTRRQLYARLEKYGIE